MPNFVALLRGINVNGKNIIRMDDLRECLGQLGFTNVRTYVQSGNVVFNSASASTTGVRKTIEHALLSDFGFAVPVLLRTPKQLAEIIAGNPFLKQPAIDISKLHTTFLLHNPPSNAEALLQPLAGTSEQLHLMGREIYLHCPAGYGNTKLSNVAIEKKLSVVATTRNWRTVCAMMDMAQ
jgi:uncharacterized protein (DUF1697 family)